MMNKHFLETEEARGIRVLCRTSGKGTVVEMPDYSTYSMSNGVRWDNKEIVNQYIGSDGVSPFRLLWRCK